MKKIVMALLLLATTVAFSRERGPSTVLEVHCKYNINEYAKNATTWTLMHEFTFVLRDFGTGLVETEVLPLERGLAVKFDGVYVTLPGVSVWGKDRHNLYLTAMLIKVSPNGNTSVVGTDLSTSDEFMNDKRFQALKNGAKDIITSHHIESTEYHTDVLLNKKIAPDAITSVNFVCEVRN